MGIFTPPPVVERTFESEGALRREYGYWRIRQLYTTFIGYAIFYFVRANFAMAMPGMQDKLGFTKETLGKFLTIGDVLYGISKFVNGLMADRANPRFFMALGLLLSGVINLFLGFASLPLTFGILIIFNGWFQGMGFPPVARVLSHWFSPGERGTMWGLWNTSHQVGAFGILVLGGYLAQYYGWRYVFFVPGIIAIGVSLFIVARLRDTPGSLGLPPVEAFRGERRPEPVDGLPAEELVEDAEPPVEDFRSIVIGRVFSNPYIWLVCFANFFVYVIRYVFMKWAPMYLHEVKGVELATSGWTVGFFEIAGLVGSLLAGWITDRWFGSRRAPVCVFYMLATGLVIYLLWQLPAGTAVGHVNVYIWLVGFFDYGPQFLVGVMMADMATKQAAATAIGLSGFFGYMSGLVSGWGMGWILQHQGWDGGFRMLVGCAILGAAFFACCWNATAWHATPAD
jgi:OPA family glycerol-3-phosphate transporter-like MFS transporter/OPA family sugar phosphate sensor protein UhpC-like MFS transporter